MGGVVGVGQGVVVCMSPSRRRSSSCQVMPHVLQVTDIRPYLSW